MKLHAPQGIAIAVLLVVSTGVLMQFFARVPQGDGAEGKRLLGMIPRVIAGWEAREEPLGDTDYQQQTVLQVLKLDRYVHRAFYKDDRYLAVFAAWWAPGRTPTRLISFHSPDICWTSQGQRCTAFRNRTPIAVDGEGWLPAEWRVFTGPEGEKTEVLFWLLVNGVPYDFGDGTGTLPSAFAWFSDLTAQLRGRRQSHLLVRISTNATWEECLKDEQMRKALAKLSQMGLGQPTTGASPR